MMLLSKRNTIFKPLLFVAMVCCNFCFAQSKNAVFYGINDVSRVFPGEEDSLKISIQNMIKISQDRDIDGLISMFRYPMVLNVKNMKIKIKDRLSGKKIIAKNSNWIFNEIINADPLMVGVVRDNVCFGNGVVYLNLYEDGWRIVTINANP